MVEENRKESLVHVLLFGFQYLAKEFPSQLLKLKPSWALLQYINIHIWKPWKLVAVHETICTYSYFFHIHFVLTQFVYVLL